MSDTPDARLAKNREWKKRNSDQQKAYNKAYNLKRRSTNELKNKTNKQVRESWHRHKIKRLEYDRLRDKLKVSARGIVRCRVYRGTLVRKPCEICGQPKAHAHHDDYSKPLSVKWLCPKHHKEIHYV